MAKKGAARVVESADVAPNWKVLQMKLKEQAASSTTEGTPTPSKKAFKRKADKPLQFRVPKKPHDDNPKKEIKDTIVVSDNNSKGELTKVLALDCEYVGVGNEGKEDRLARVSIVNEEGAVLYDVYVKVEEKIVDYRTEVSGIRPAHLVNGLKFENVQKEVRKLINGRIVVGHAIYNDFRVMGLIHPRRLTRDTASRLQTIRKLLSRQTPRPSLKMLAKDILGIDIQQGEHDSITDARVALRIYTNLKKNWENEIKKFRH